MKLMADSKKTKNARTKTPAEKELAIERSKQVRRIFKLFKLLRNEIFTVSLSIDTEIPPSSPVDSIPSPAFHGDSQESFENAITVACDPIDGEISEADLNRFANLRLEPNQSNGGGERYMKALHLLDTFLRRIAGVCAVFNGFDPATTAYLLLKSHPSIYLAFPIIQDVIFDFIICVPPPHLQLPLLKHCIDNKVPSFLYLPMHILNAYTIDKAKSRLILYITGDHVEMKKSQNKK